MTRRARAVAGTLAALALATASAGAAEESTVPSDFVNDGNLQVGLGPLRIPSQSPGQSLRLGILPRTPSNLPVGTWQGFTSATWVNVWANTEDVHLDYESATVSAALAYGLADGWQVEGEVTMRTTFGGYMDGFIEGFHRTFGIGQDGRTAAPRGETAIDIAPSSSQPGLHEDNKDLQRDRAYFARGYVEHTLLHGDDLLPVVALALTAQAPVGHNRLVNGGAVDVGANLAIAKRFGTLVCYTSVAYTRFGADTLSGITLHRSNWSGMAALEYNHNNNASLVVQYLLSQGVAPDYHDLSKASHEVAIGVKFTTGEATEVELGVIENLFVFDNSPDFGVHLGVAHRF